MKNELWIVILVITVFMGFIMGYSLPPMIEVGMIGGKPEQAIGVKSGVNKEMEQYYKELEKEAD